MAASTALQTSATRRACLQRLTLGLGSLALSPLVTACGIFGGPAPTPTAAASPTSSAPTPPVSVPTPTTSPLPTLTPSPSPSPSPTASPRPTATATPQFSVAASLHREQVLRLGTPDEPATLDPSLAGDPGSATVVDQLFAKLMRYRPDLSVEPDLAERYTVSPDGKTYTFQLRDWKWSDGKAGSAKDFEYAFKRGADPRTAAPNTMFSEILRGGPELVGALGTVLKPKRPSDEDLAKLRDALGVKAVDDRTLQVDLVSPTPYFLTMLPLPILAPLRQDVVEKHGDRWTLPGNLISNGAFSLSSQTPGSRLTLKRSSSYHGMAPTLERVEMTFQAEATSLAAYDKGELDLAIGVPPAELARIRQDPKLSLELTSGGRLATCYVGFAHRQRPFDERRVRQAFQMAIDPTPFSESALGGAIRPAMSLIPPGMPGYQAELGLGFLPGRAAQLLVEVGYAGGQGFPKVTLVYGAGAANKATAEYVRSEIKRNLGIELAVESWDAATYLGRIATANPALSLLRWNSEYPHPDAWMRAAFRSTSPANAGKWSSADFDRLVDQAAAEADARKSLDLAAQSQRLLVDEAAGLWLHHPGRFSLAKPWVKGLVSTGQDSTPGSCFWDRVQIEAH